MSAIVRVNAHAEGTSAPPAGGTIVVSRIGRGESHIGGPCPAIKMVVDGEEVHEIDGRPYPVKPGQMLLVDRGAPYTAKVRRSIETRGLCVYFPAAPAEAPEEPLLGRALLQPTQTVLGTKLLHLAKHLHQGRGEDPDADEVLRALGDAFWAAVGDASRGMAMLRVQKASTRHGVYNRLEIARGFLHANPNRAVPLGELAKVAGLSSFHLARYFSAAYGMPPGRYHRQVRLERAAEVIRAGWMSITDAATLAGYSELSAFTNAFRRCYGIPPSALT